MCSVSVIYDYFRDRTFPQPWPNPVPTGPGLAPIDWTPETLKLLKEIIAQLEVLDAKTGQPNCEDPAKAKWMRDVERRLSRLEDAPDIDRSVPVP